MISNISANTALNNIDLSQIVNNTVQKNNTSQNTNNNTVQNNNKNTQVNNNNLLEEIKTDLTWQNFVQFEIQLICAYLGMEILPHFQKKIPDTHYNLKHLEKTKMGTALKNNYIHLSNPIQTINNLTGINIKDRPFALALGLLTGTGLIKLLQNNDSLPSSSNQKKDEKKHFDFLEILIDLGSSLACADLFSKRWNNHLTRFMGIGIGFLLGELINKIQIYMEKEIENKLFDQFPQLKPSENAKNNISFGSVLAMALSLKILFLLKSIFILLPSKKIYHFTHLNGSARKFGNDYMTSFSNMILDNFRIFTRSSKPLPKFDHNDLLLKNINKTAEHLAIYSKDLDKSNLPKIAKIFIKPIIEMKRMIFKYILGSPNWLKELEKPKTSNLLQINAIAKDYILALGVKSSLLIVTFPVFLLISYISQITDNLIKKIFPEKNKKEDLLITLKNLNISQ